MSFICMRIKNHFLINGVEVSLALKQRFEATRKWPFSLLKTKLVPSCTKRTYPAVYFFRQFIGTLAGGSVGKQSSLRICQDKLRLFFCRKINSRNVRTNKLSAC